MELSNSLATHAFTFGLIQKVVDEIKKIPHWELKRLDNELTKTVCNFISKEVKKAVKNKTITYKQAQTLNKNSILTEALKAVFTLTDEECLKLENDFVFLLENQLLRLTPWIDYIESFFAIKRKSASQI